MIVFAFEDVLRATVAEFKQKNAFDTHRRARVLRESNEWQLLHAPKSLQHTTCGMSGSTEVRADL